MVMYRGRGRIRLPLKRPDTGDIFHMILPYLSSSPPEVRIRFAREIIQVSGSLPAPWAFHPSVVLTELLQYSATEVSLSCDVSKLYFGSCPKLAGRYPARILRSSWRSPLLWLLITGLYLMNVYSVVRVQFVSFECSNLVATVISLFGKHPSAVAVARPFR